MLYLQLIFRVCILKQDPFHCNILVLYLITEQFFNTLYYFTFKGDIISDIGRC